MTADESLVAVTRSLTYEQREAVLYAVYVSIEVVLRTFLTMPEEELSDACAEITEIMADVLDGIAQ